MSKYIKSEQKGQIIFVVMIVLAIIIGLVWNALEESSVKTWEPDSEYPIVNSHISWEQSYREGSWNE